MSKKLEILYEDNHLIAVNKTGSDLVQGDETGDETLVDRVKAYIKEKYDKPGDVFLGVVHRLDRPVSGVVIYARTSKALARMNAIFQERQVKKIYWALVKNLPPHDEAELNDYIYKDEARNKSHAFQTDKKGARLGTLVYRLAASLSNYHLLEIELKTGRHHQIRCQLAKIGCPIKGDLKYGAPRSNEGGGISLHARRIEFIHPIKNEPIKIVANPPKEDVLWKEFFNVMK